jgi:hypothetical protein
MKKNVVKRGGLTDQLAIAFRQGEFELYQEKTADRLGRRLEQLTPLELRIVRGLAALWMTHERHLPPNRSLQALRNREGDLIKFVEDVVSSGLESSGYRRLTAAGFDDLVFERVILDHPDVFSEKARANARRRLNALEQAPIDAEAEDDELRLGDGEYSTKKLLDDMGFRKPQPTARHRKVLTMALRRSCLCMETLRSESSWLRCLRKRRQHKLKH